MNVFFTCKNTLVILLQLYRLYVVHSENNKPKKKSTTDFELTDISIISKMDMYDTNKQKRRPKYKPNKQPKNKSKSKSHRTHKPCTPVQSQCETDEVSNDSEDERIKKKMKHHAKKDTGYSTASSHASTRRAHQKEKHASRNKSKQRTLKRSDSVASQSGSENDVSTEPEAPRDTQKARKKKITKVITTSSASTRSGDSD